MRKIIFLLMALVPSLSFATDLNDKFEYIIIDPAHGGEDPGAIGINNIKEKDETLKFSMMLKSEIESQSGQKVKLTRKQDETIKRNHKRNLDNKALVFIIHAGAAQDDRVHGVSVTTNPKLIKEQTIKDIFSSNDVNVNVIEKENEPLNYISLDIGYITNKGDVERLNSKSYRENIAKSISEITSKIIVK